MPQEAVIVDPPSPFVFDLVPGTDPCRNATGLDLDVTLGPPIGVTAWPDDLGAANGTVTGADPIGSGKSYQADVAVGAPVAAWTDGGTVTTL